MKITEKQLRQLIREGLQKQLNESVALSAKRRLTLAAKEHSLDFEKKIIDMLGLKDPDELPEDSQESFIAIVEEMQNKIVSAVQDAVARLAVFPREDGSVPATAMPKVAPRTNSIVRPQAKIPRVKP